jgi:prepilin-type N-terminal cleavage/methylation domain-containing protein
MIKIQSGFSLVELIVAMVIIIAITGSIMYGIASTHNSLRNAEIRQLAFIELSNKMEELKGQVALNRVQSASINEAKVCIEYNTIDDMIAGRNTGSGCRTVGYLSHNIKFRQTESVHAKIKDINASIRWKLIYGYGQNKDTTLSLNVSQLIFN